jgi:predicted nucleic acid-binding protein
VRIALDTNCYCDAARSDERVMGLLRRAEEVYLPFVVLAELRAGFRGGNQAGPNEANLSQFLDSPRVHVLYADDQTTHHYARLYAQLRARRTPVPTNDLWIAALVLQHDLMLVTRDEHFSRIPEIARI